MFAFSLIFRRYLTTFVIHAVPLLLGSASPVYATQLLDEVAAIANGRLITASEAMQRANVLQAQQQTLGKKTPSQEQLFHEALEQLILENIQIQEANDTGLTISDAQLDYIVEQIAKKNHLTVNALRQEIERGQPFSVYRENLRKEVQISHLQEREVFSKTQVFDSEINSYIAEYMKQDMNGVPNELRIEELLIPVSEKTTAEENLKLAELAKTLLKKWQTGASPRKLAHDAKVQYISLNFQATEKLPVALVNAVKDMPTGSFAPEPVLTEQGWHVLRLLGRHQETKTATIKLPQLHLRQIVLRVSNTASENEAKRRLMALRTRIKNGDDFAALARQYSQDPSADQGGELDWLTLNDLPMEIAQSIEQLEEGQMSEPIAYQGRMLLIQLLGRREVSISPEQQREFARNALRERKNALALNDWLRQLRESATVDYRLDKH